jgi:hypothetical protein
MDKPIPMHNRVSLLTLARGSGVELFQRSLDRALEDMADLNKPWSKKRVITLVVEMTPNDEKRDEAVVDITCGEKFPGVKPATTTIHMGTIGGELVAMESTLRQANMFDKDKVETAVAKATAPKDEVN